MGMDKAANFAMTKQTWHAVFLFTAAYIAGVWLGNLFLYRPDGVSVLWPAAAIAISGLLIGGLKLWPCIVLGDLLLKLLMLSGLVALPSEVGASFLETIGATIQAVVGAAYISKHLSATLEGDMRAIAKVYVVGILLCCAISPTFGVGSMLLLGEIDFASAPAAWFSWWVADSTPIYLIAPIVLLMAAAKNKFKDIKYYILLPSTLLVTAVVAISMLWFNADEKNAATVPLIVRSQLALELFSERLTNTARTVQSTEYFISSEDELSAEELERYVSRFDVTGLEAIAWFPRVTDSQLNDSPVVPGFESTNQLNIITLNEQGELVPAARSNDYFPMVYVSNPVFGSRFIGFDLSLLANNEQYRGNDNSPDQGMFSGSIAVPTIDEPYLIYYEPVYKPNVDVSSGDAVGRREDLRGVIVGILNPASLARDLESGEQNTDLMYSLVVTTSGGDTLRLFGDSAEDDNQILIDSGTIEFRGLSFAWSTHTQRGFWSANRSAKSIGFRIAVVLGVMLYSLILLNGITRNRVIRNQVVERTRELREKSSKLRQALDIANVYNWTMDMQSRLITMDDRSYVFLETSAAEQGGYEITLSQWMQRFLHPDDLKTLRELIAQKWQANSELSKECEGRLVTSKGNIRHVMLRFNAQYDGQGNIVSVLGTTQDITQRKAMTLALRESEEYSKSIIASSQDCIQILDLQGRILDITDRGIEMLCVPSIDAIIHTSWNDFWVREQDQRSVNTALADANAKRIGRFQGYAPSMDGSNKWWDVVVTPILGADGRPKRLLAVSRDITAERESQYALEQLNESLEDEISSRASELKESEKQLRATVDNAAVGIIHVKPNGDIIRCNPQLTHITGYEHAEMLELSVENLLHPEDLSNFHQFALKGCEDGASTFKKELRCVDKTQRVRWLRLSGSAVYDEAGALQYWVILVEDIHEHREVEQALIESEKLYRNMFESNPIPMWAFNTNTLEISSVNKAAIEHYGYSESEFLTMTIMDLRPESEQESIKAHMDKREAHEYSRLDNVLHKRKDGSIIHVDISSHELKDSSSHSRIVLANDISDRIKASEALGQQQKLTSLLLENLSEGVVACDKEGQLIMFNKAARDWHGTDPRSIPAEQWGDHYNLFHADGTTAMLTDEIPLVRAFDGEVVRSAEMSIIRRDAEARYVLASGGPLFDDKGEKQGAVVVMHDVTERNRSARALERSTHELEVANAKIENERATLAERVAKRTLELTLANEKLLQAKAEAEAASRAKSAFLAVMSHEIRTPMNGIVGMVDVMSHSELDERHVGAVRTIKDSAFSLLEIIDDILDFSKIEANAMALERRSLDLHSLVESVGDSLSTIAHKKGVTLDLCVDPRLPRFVWGDQTRLRQVVTNLVGNAIKFSSGRALVSGAVRILVERSESSASALLIKVVDNGIGIAQDQVPKLFTSFNQAETSTTRVFGGTGLGLAISKRLVELMGGDITVVSELNQGSTFTVELPLEAVDCSANDEMPDLRGVNCLLVDSEVGIADELAAYLELAGTTVTRQGSLESAVQQCRTEDFGAMVTIVNTTGLNDPSKQELEALVAEYDDVNFLLINRGMQCKPQFVRPGLTRLDGNFSLRLELLEAVAIAAGKVSPQQSEESPSTSISNYSAAPSIADARASENLILVAEDDKTNQKVILLQLSMLGFAAEVAADGEEALRMWQSGSYACVLTDLHMPKMDGFALTQKIRASEQDGQRVPILMLTANALTGEAEKAQQQGVDAYLTKPLQLEVLGDALRKWMPASTASDINPSARSVKEPKAKDIDLSILRRILGDDEAMTHEILADYLAAVPQIRDELLQAGEEKKFTKISGLAHRLKGSSRTVGAVAVGDLCAELENAGRSENHVGVQRCMGKLLPALQEAIDHIHASLYESDVA